MRYNKCLNRASSVLIVQSYHATHLITTHGWCLWWCKNVSNLFGYNGMPFLRRKIWNMFTCELSSSVLSQKRGRFDRTTMADWRNNRWRMASVTIVPSMDPNWCIEIIMNIIASRPVGGWGSLELLNKSSTSTLSVCLDTCPVRLYLVLGW